MSEKPILFSTPMVQAILDGRKTITRRIVKEKPPITPYRCRYKVDDVLYVRETYMEAPNYPDLPEEYYYKASMCEQFLDEWKGCWKPNIHMPKVAARIFLKVTNVTVEHLNDITEQDAIAEGVEPFMNDYYKHYSPELEFTKESLAEGRPFCRSARSSFTSLWNSINGKHSWLENPWVWVIEFKKIEKI